MTPTQKALYALGGVVLWKALSPFLQPWLVENVAPTAVAALGRSLGAALTALVGVAFCVTLIMLPQYLAGKIPKWRRDWSSRKLETKGPQSSAEVSPLLLITPQADGVEAAGESPRVRGAGAVARVSIGRRGGFELRSSNLRLLLALFAGALATVGVQSAYRAISVPAVQRFHNRAVRDSGIDTSRALRETRESCRAFGGYPDYGAFNEAAKSLQLFPIVELRRTSKTLDWRIEVAAEEVARLRRLESECDDSALGIRVELLDSDGYTLITDRWPLTEEMLSRVSAMKGSFDIPVAKPKLQSQVHAVEAFPELQKGDPYAWLSR